MDSDDVVAGTNATAAQYNLLRADLINHQYDLARQALINPNFTIWQRNITKTNPANNEYVADRWGVVFDVDGGTPPSNIIHSRQAFTPGTLDHAYYYYRINPDGAGSGLGVNSYYGLVQRILHGVRHLCGLNKSISMSIWARSSLAGKRIGVYLEQYYGSGGSPSASENITGDNFTLTSTLTKFTKTFTTNTLVGKTFGTNNDDLLIPWILEQWGSTKASLVGASSAETHGGSGTIDIAQIQLNLGDVVLKFLPRSFGAELELCLPYYEKSFLYNTAPANGADYHMVVGGKVNTGNGAAFSTIPFKAPKIRRNYTLAFYSYNGGTSGQWGASIGTAANVDYTPSVDQQSEYGFNVALGSGLTNGNAAYAFGHWTADAEL